MLKKSVIFILGCVLYYNKDAATVQNLLKLSTYLLFTVAQCVCEISHFIIISSWPIIMFIIFCAIPKCFHCIYQFAGFVNWVTLQIFYALCGFTRPEMALVAWIFVISTVYLVIDAKLIRPCVTRFVDQRDVQRTTEMLNTEVLDTDGLNTDTQERVAEVRQAGLGNNERQEQPNNPSSSGSENSDGQLPDKSESGNTRHRTRNKKHIEKHNPPKDDSSTDCIVCCDRPRNVALFPCGHTQLCHICVVEVRARNSRCPICQTWFNEFRTIYL